MLAACALQLLTCQERILQLEELLSDGEARLQQVHTQAAVLAAERDAAARNLLRAEAELNDVNEYSTKMFRQVSYGASEGGGIQRGAFWAFNGAGQSWAVA